MGLVGMVGVRVRAEKDMSLKVLKKIDVQGCVCVCVCLTEKERLLWLLGSVKSVADGSLGKKKTQQPLW